MAGFVIFNHVKLPVLTPGIIRLYSPHQVPLTRGTNMNVYTHNMLPTAIVVERDGQFFAVSSGAWRAIPAPMRGNLTVVSPVMVAMMQLSGTLPRE